MSADDTAPMLPGLADPPAPTGGMGPTEAAVRASIAHAQLDDRDAGAAELAAQQARALDVAQAKNRDYAIAQLSRELREQLTRLRLDPVARLGQDAGEVAAWLQQLTGARPQQ